MEEAWGRRKGRIAPSSQILDESLPRQTPELSTVSAAMQSSSGQDKDRTGWRVPCRVRSFIRSGCKAQCQMCRIQAQSKYSLVMSRHDSRCGRLYQFPGIERNAFVVLLDLVPRDLRPLNIHAPFGRGH